MGSKKWTSIGYIVSVISLILALALALAVQNQHTDLHYLIIYTFLTDTLTNQL